jgi:hypothetical protein
VPHALLDAIARDVVLAGSGRVARAHRMPRKQIGELAGVSLLPRAIASL